jgi:hypothetical protein
MKAMQVFEAVDLVLDSTVLVISLFGSLLSYCPDGCHWNLGIIKAYNVCA